MPPLTFRRLPDASDSAWRPLISLYEDSFEDAQLETEAGILRSLSTPARPRVGGHQVIGAFDSNEACIGGIIFSYLPAIDCGYLSYLFVRSRFRRQGVATALLQEARSNLAAAAVAAGRPRVVGSFAEIQRGGHPGPIVDERLRFWARVGVLPLDFEWRYPPLRPDVPAVPTYLAYGSYGLERERWFPRDIERVAIAIFEATYDYLPEASATLRAIIGALRRMSPDTLIPYLTHPAPAPTKGMPSVRCISLG